MLDINLNSATKKFCNGWNRRDFLRVGAIAPLGFSLANLLQAQSANAAAATKRAKSIVLVYLGGGISHHDSFDPKPNASAEIKGKYSTIQTKLPGISYGELVPLLAQQNDLYTLIRSGAHNNDHHETATNWVMSGRFGSAFGDYPAIGAVVAHETGFSGTLPPYVAVPRNPSFTWELGKSAFLGGRYESFKAGDPSQANYKVQDVSPTDTITPKSVERRG